MSEKVLMKGNEAIAEAAILAGLSLFRLSDYSSNRDCRLYGKENAQN